MFIVVDYSLKYKTKHKDKQFIKSQVLTFIFYDILKILIRSFKSCYIDYFS